MLVHGGRNIYGKSSSTFWGIFIKIPKLIPRVATLMYTLQSHKRNHTRSLFSNTLVYRFSTLENKNPARIRFRMTQKILPHGEPSFLEQSFLGWYRVISIHRDLEYCNIHSQSPNNGILKNNCYNTSTSTSQYFLVLGPPEARKPNTGPYSP